MASKATGSNLIRVAHKRHPNALPELFDGVL